MKEKDRKARNDERVKELYPVFAERVKAIITDMEALGERPRIQDAWRSPEDQLKAVHDGFSLVKFGFHNVTAADGTKESLAVDMLDDNFPVGGAPDLSYFIKLAFVAEQHKCRTGIRFSATKDPLTDDQILAINKAIAAKKWTAKLKMGFDPTHIEPTDVTITQAKNGKRPTA